MGIQDMPVRFFLGANTPVGFVGYLDDLYDCHDGWRAYIIKSGPGTGKASLMQAALKHMTGLGYRAECILCSSDPHSLDGIIFRELKLCLFDGTAPHVIEPHYWGAVEQIVNLAGAMDTARLYARQKDIIEITDTCSALHARGRRFLDAASSLLSDSARMAAECTDAGKVSRTAARIAAREFGAGDGGAGREWRRFLSAVTPEGLMTFHDTLQALCPRIYSLEDEYGAASRLLLSELRERALEAGLEIVTCACPLAPSDKPEHLLIPSLGLGFTTSNSWHKADFPVYRRIHAARFTDVEALRQRRQRLSFNRRASRELIGEAVYIARCAKETHDALEALNQEAMDWDRVNETTLWVLEEMTRIAGETR
ncbi:MAG: hypothetical protein HFJ80_05155 [Clostridiales bacterium]|nr:hypothetical protein [Clostridiales bacterium]